MILGRLAKVYSLPLSVSRFHSLTLYTHSPLSHSFIHSGQSIIHSYSFFLFQFQITTLRFPSLESSSPFNSYSFFPLCPSLSLPLSWLPISKQKPKRPSSKTTSNSPWTFFLRPFTSNPTKPNSTPTEPKPTSNSTTSLVHHLSLP